MVVGRVGGLELLEVASMADEKVAASAAMTAASWAVLKADEKVLYLAVKKVA